MRAACLLRSLVLPGAIAGLVACGPPKPALDTTVTTAAALAAPPSPKEMQAAAAFDPLGVDGAFETGTVRKVTYTPAKHVLNKSRADLEAALQGARNADTPTKARRLVTWRVGSPTWVEDGRRSVWVAWGRSECHRLVLDADGSTTLETVRRTAEWKMISALAHQNACTGEIRRGLTGSR